MQTAAPPPASTSNTAPSNAPAAPRRRLRLTLLIPLVVLVVIVGALATIVGVALLTAGKVSAAPVTSAAFRFDGRYLIAASDADMTGTAYADGVLRQIPGAVDTLSLVALPFTGEDAATVYTVPASNSVTSWPQITAVSPDGTRIYVVETAQPVEDGVAQLNTDLFPPGRLVTAVDISAGADAPQVTTVEVGSGAAHLAISTDGAYLAVGLQEPGRQLAVLPTATLDDAATFAYFPVERSDGQPAGEVTSVNWHPSGDFVAVGIDGDEIQFYRVERADGTLTLTPHGERITGGYALTYGQFTRDGRHYLVSEINWERYPYPFDSLNNPPSEMISVRFDATDAAQHTVVSRVPVGLSAEGFAVSPQEDLIVTVNMRRTYLPDGLAFWPGAALNSLSLLTFENETGALAVVGGEYGFEGVLPEDAMFDADGDALGVVIYNERDEPMKPGYIEFWNVVRDGGTPRLERTDVRVTVERGAHAMNLIP